jgi:hypothetical protein
MDPVQCSSVHFRVEMLNDHVSLKTRRLSLPPPPNLQSLIMRGEGEGTKKDTNMMIRSPVVTETWPALGRGFSFPGAGSYDSQKGCEFTVEKSVRMVQRREVQTYSNSNPMPKYHLSTCPRSCHQRRKAWNRPMTWYGSNDLRARAH